MIYQGSAFRIPPLAEGFAELCFDLEGESVNTFGRQALADLRQAIEVLKRQRGLRGVLLTSGKDSFVVGADITEFLGAFAEPEALAEGNRVVNRLFSELEDLPVPSVAAINGLALGGGFEVCLACDFRVAARSARVGLPEVKLGIYPGWGGTVRLPRLIGADNAVEWIASGKEQDAEAALKAGAVDAVVADERLREAALDLLRRAATGELDYHGRRARKQAPLTLSPIEQMMAFESAKAVVAGQAGRHYPAPVEAVKRMQKAAGLARDAALAVEAEGFLALAGGEVARNLVGLFLNDQVLKRKAKAVERNARPVRQAAVLGAGIMGGGIAYQSASRGIPILMKDVRPSALELGLAEAGKLLEKRVQSGRMDTAGLARALSAIRPTLSYGDFAGADLVVEAVVENPAVKRAVLAEVEAQLDEQAILASNTSTISIDSLAGALKRPEQFCGMHFFNPVHRMPLVEVIRGERSGEAAIATTVAYARALGKTPIVVRDCPGFLVNRVLFPYFGGFARLLAAGVDFRRVDRVMEAFGWPMGPAYLLDVVGLDTARHAQAVMAEAYPDRMGQEGPSAIESLFQAGRLGQKSGQGFYRYEPDRRGKPQKRDDPTVDPLLAAVVQAPRELSDDDIVDLMMLPLCLEAVRCLEEGIVETPAEVDMGLVYGIGFPPFRGGALRYVDSLGLTGFVALAERHASFGPLYRVTDGLRERAAAQRTFYA